MRQQTALTWVQDRLSDWAHWAGGGAYCEGYPGKVPFVEDRIQNGRGFIEASPEILLTDKAVGRVRMNEPMHWRIIQKRYLLGLPDWEVATEIRRPLDVTQMWIWAAESATGRWIMRLERETSQELRRVAYS